MNRTFAPLCPVNKDQPDTSSLLPASATNRAQQVLRMKQLVERTGLSRATLYVLMKTDPTFPPKIQLSVRCVGWNEQNIADWLVARMQASPATSGALKEAA